MNTLVLATATFIGIHFLIAGTPIRAALVGMIGEKAFQALFFLAALLALVWMFTAYSQAPRTTLWEVPAGLNGLFMLLNLIACLFVAAGLTVKNPSTLWMDKMLHGEQVVTGFLRITRHPMNMGLARGRWPMFCKPAKPPHWSCLAASSRSPPWAPWESTPNATRLTANNGKSSWPKRLTCRSGRS